MRFDHGLRAGDTITSNQLTSIFLCGPQGGMRRSHRTNSLVIISGHTKSVYEDRWIAEDIIHYTGMGLEGEQRLAYAQNKTLAESKTNGVNLYLFEVYDSGNYLFRGQVELANSPFQENQPDKNDVIRMVWVFPMHVVGIDATFKVPEDLVAKKQRTKERIAKRLSDNELFTRAIHSRRQPVNRKVSSTTYERNVYVAELAKRRANGVCQLCKLPAPFKNKSGEGYLEDHHIVRLSEGGADTVENAVALCPNCHRKMHILNLKSDRKELEKEAQKTCCQLTFTGRSVFV